MSSALISKNGREVVLRLDFYELEALEALLAAIGEDTYTCRRTGRNLGDDLLNSFWALRDVRDQLEAAGLLSGAYDGLREPGGPVVRSVEQDEQDEE